MRLKELVFLLVIVPSWAYADYASGLRSAQAKDFAGALREWLPLAEQGNAKAQQGMCILYSRGDGVQQNYQEAMRWCQKAADQGNAAAENGIGTLYMFGRGVAQDYAEAAKWYQKAADHGSVAAQNNLGYQYLKGHGVDQDYVKAEMWFSLSGPGTDKEDADARADVAAHLTTDQMAQALRLAQEWRANRAASRVSAIRVAPTAPIVSVAPAPRVPPVTLPAPALRTTVRWSAGDPSSEQRWVEGMLVEAITLRGIQVATSICEMPNGLFSAFVYVHNMDDAPMAVIPSNFSIQITNPPGKQFASLPPEKGMVRGGWGTAIAGAIAGGAQGWSDASQKKTASATVTNPDGTTSQVDIYTTGPTQQEIDQRNRAAQQRNDEAAERNRYNQGIQQAAIRSTMLDPQQVVSGVVFFPREQTKYHEVVINIPIREAVFQFPFQFK